MSVSELLLRKTSRDRRGFFKKKKLRDGAVLRGASCPTALDPDLVNFPSIIAREGKSLNLWLKKYWPAYFLEVFENGSPNTDPEMNKKFEMDFMNRFSEYVSETNEKWSDSESSYGGSVSPENDRKRLVDLRMASKKTFWLPRNYGNTIEKWQKPNKHGKNRTSTTCNPNRNKSDGSFQNKFRQPPENLSTYMEYFSDSELETKKKEKPVFRDDLNNNRFAAINRNGRSVKIKTNYTERHIPIPPTVDNATQQTSFKPVAPDAADEKRVTYRRSVTFAAEIAHKAKLFEQKRKQRLDSGLETYYQSQMVSLPLIVNQGETDQMYTTKATSLPHFGNMTEQSMNGNKNNMTQTDDCTENAVYGVTNSNESGWVEVRDVTIAAERISSANSESARIPSGNNCAKACRAEKEGALKDDSSVGSSFHVKWKPGFQTKHLTSNTSNKKNIIEKKLFSDNYDIAHTRENVTDITKSNTVSLHAYVNINSSSENLHAYKERRRRPSDEGILADWDPDNDSFDVNFDIFEQLPIKNRPSIIKSIRNEAKKNYTSLQSDINPVSAPTSISTSRLEYLKFPSVMYLPPVDYDAVSMPSNFISLVDNKDDTQKISVFTQTTSSKGPTIPAAITFDQNRNKINIEKSSPLARCRNCFCSCSEQDDDENGRKYKCFKENCYGTYKNCEYCFENFNNKPVIKRSASTSNLLDPYNNNYSQNSQIKSGIRPKEHQTGKLQRCNSSELIARGDCQDCLTELTKRKNLINESPVEKNQTRLYSLSASRGRRPPNIINRTTDQRNCESKHHSRHQKLTRHRRIAQRRQRKRCATQRRRRRARFITSSARRKSSKAMTQYSARYSAHS